MMGRRRRGEAGYTLVELMVACVVLGLVTLLLFNGMRFVRRATASADARREAVESTTTGLGLMRETLGRALPLLRKVEGKDQLVFTGEEDRVRFATFEPDYVPGWPMVAYEYSVALRDGRYLLEVRRAALDPARPDLGVVEEAEPRAVMGFAQGVRISYFGRLKPKDPPSWRQVWREGELLPQAVRIGPDDPEPGWPDFVLPLTLNTPAACLNPNAKETKGCGR